MRIEGEEGLVVEDRARLSCWERVVSRVDVISRDDGYDDDGVGVGVGDDDDDGLDRWGRDNCWSMASDVVVAVAVAADAVIVVVVVVVEGVEKQ